LQLHSSELTADPMIVPLVDDMEYTIS
jgi:hypothetical protein